MALEGTQAAEVQDEEESIKDYENAKNNYGDTFFDLYCHCKQRHEQASSNFMIQCLFCEDWFHN